MIYLGKLTDYRWSWWKTIDTWLRMMHFPYKKCEHFRPLSLPFSLALVLSALNRQNTKGHETGKGISPTHPPLPPQLHMTLLGNNVILGCTSMYLVDLDSLCKHPGVDGKSVVFCWLLVFFVFWKDGESVISALGFSRCCTGPSIVPWWGVFESFGLGWLVVYVGSYSRNPVFLKGFWENRHVWNILYILALSTTCLNNFLITSWI